MDDFNTPTKSKFNNLIVKWIKENLIPIKSNYNLKSSYSLKHHFEFNTGLYTTNGEFKYAMRDAGFEYVDTVGDYKNPDINWLYRISRRSPGLLWVSQGIKRPDNYSRSIDEYKVDGWKPISVDEAIKLSEELENAK